MANSAEQYQDEIKLIFDEFIELMHTSATRVEVDIAKYQLIFGSVDRVLDLCLPRSSLFGICVT